MIFLLEIAPTQGLNVVWFFFLLKLGQCHDIRTHLDGRTS